MISLAGNLTKAFFFGIILIEIDFQFLFTKKICNQMPQ